MSIEFKDKKIAVLGFAVEGQAMTDLLLQRGCHITVYDDKELNSELRQKYEIQGVNFHMGAFGDLTGYDVISRTPGIRLDRLEIHQALVAGVAVTSNTKLFLAEAKGLVIGVTGTKGKGTTAQLLFNIISSARDNVWLGGNIGQSPLKFLSQLNDQSITILELSSFQLADVTKSPQIAIVLMVTSEHLDYHHSPEDYVQAKAGITKFQTSDDTVIYNLDYPASVKIAEQSKGRKFGVSVGATLDSPSLVNCFVKNGNIIIRLDSKEQIIMPVADIGLVGQHNWGNVGSAILAAKILKVDNQAIIKVVKEFHGLEHRLEFVAEVNGVKYYNDSISTTPESTMAAIKAFTEPKILILGGSSKNSDFTAVGQMIKVSKSIKGIIGIGTEWPKIKQSIGSNEITLIENCQTMPEIVTAASKLAQPGTVAILSPACASFGLFKDYKDRGQQFKKAIFSLGHNS